MRICVIGPTYNKKSFGGVATFNEGLKESFKSLGHETLVITNDYSSHDETLYFDKFTFLFNQKKIINVIERFKPDLIITSMWYVILNKNIKKALNKSKVVHFLHGFPTFRYSLLKRTLLNKLFQSKRKYTDYYISNSNITSFVNNEIFGIKSDGVIHLGLNESYEDLEKNSDGKIRFLFAGRIDQTKNVEVACELFNTISDYKEEIEFLIIGDGPLRKEIERKYANSNIKFLGKKSRSETLHYFKKSDIFISLNPHEPFGLVYLEAVINKCKIICPNTGGQTEYLKFKNDVLFIDINNPQKHKMDIINLIQRNAYKDVNLKDFFDYYNYQRVANDLLRLT
ncbi:glycosyltransferase family 4 protein [Halobacillus sp. B29]|uniref:glycosyltransferase family 4 protein n=1 Tax=Halobacillus sp. B29 TaxID=3457432 RepID=UPI003FCCEAED